MGGQLRAISGGGIIGWDLGAAMALAQALAIDPFLAAEILPAIEAVAVRGINRNILDLADSGNG